jgi:WD40 repeat protein
MSHGIVMSYDWKSWKTLTGHTDWVKSAAFQPKKLDPKDPDIVASGSEDHSIKIWNVKRGNRMG